MTWRKQQHRPSPLPQVRLVARVATSSLPLPNRALAVTGLISSVVRCSCRIDSPGLEILTTTAWCPFGSLLSWFVDKPCMVIAIAAHAHETCFKTSVNILKLNIDRIFDVSCHLSVRLLSHGVTYCHTESFTFTRSHLLSHSHLHSHESLTVTRSHLHPNGVTYIHTESLTVTRSHLHSHEVTYCHTESLANAIRLAINSDEVKTEYVIRFL